jgi:ABC-type sugar transport system ATPase subunit
MDHFYKELTVEQQLRFSAKLAPRAAPYMLQEEFDGEMPSDDEAIESDIQYCLRVILSFVSYFSQTLNLMKRKDKISTNLSGGEKKRFNMALELMCHPSVFFLDEVNIFIFLHFSQPLVLTVLLPFLFVKKCENSQSATT